MIPIYSNGLVVWDELEIQTRNNFVEYIVKYLAKRIQEVNKAWTFHRIETPVLLPQSFVNSSYDESDILVTQIEAEPNIKLVLRPETTAGSYLYAEQLITSKGKNISPICVYQLGQSFRNERDKTLKHIRLKAFYQLEFQFIYDEKSKADYPEHLRTITLVCLQGLLQRYGMCIEPSDRLPSYSLRTDDVLVSLPEEEKSTAEAYLMEVCSMSERTDFPMDGMKNMEIAIGIDRLVYIHGLY